MYLFSSHFAYSHMLWFAKYYLYVYVSCEESSATKYISCNKKVDHIQCNRLVTQTLIWMYYCCYIFVIWHVCITYNSTNGLCYYQTSFHMWVCCCPFIPLVEGGWFWTRYLALVSQFGVSFFFFFFLSLVSFANIPLCIPVIADHDHSRIVLLVCKLSDLS